MAKYIPNILQDLSSYEGSSRKFDLAIFRRRVKASKALFLFQTDYNRKIRELSAPLLVIYTNIPMSKLITSLYFCKLLPQVTWSLCYNILVIPGEIVIYCFFCYRQEICQHKCQVELNCNIDTQKMPAGGFRCNEIASPRRCILVNSDIYLKKE